MKTSLLKSSLLATALWVTTADAQMYKWAKSLQGGDRSVGHAIALDAARHVITAGYFSGTVDFDPSSSVSNLISATTSFDCYIQQSDSSGNFSWARRMGGDDDDEATAIATDASGNIYATGYFTTGIDFDPLHSGTVTGTANGASDVFVVKFSSAGNVLWAKTFGGSGYDQGNGIALDATGNIFISGTFESTADFDPSAATVARTSNGNRDAFVLKLNSSGDYVWVNTFGSTEEEHCNAVAVDHSGNVLVTGSFQNTVNFDPVGIHNFTAYGFGDIFVLKLDNSGSYVWAGAAGGTDYDDAGVGIATDRANNVFVTGYYRGNIDLNPGLGVDSFSWHSYTDIFLLKMTAAGAYSWGRVMGGSIYDRGYSVATDTFGNVYCTGHFEGTATFSETGPVVLNSNGDGNAYIQKWSGAGTLIWAKSLEGSGDDTGEGIVVDESANIYATGEYSIATDFDPNAGVAAITNSSANTSSFILKWSSEEPAHPQGIAAISRGMLRAWPIPANDRLTIALPEAMSGILSVTNPLGQVLQQQEVNGNHATFSVQELPAGNYLLNWKGENAMQSVRFVKGN